MEASDAEGTDTAEQPEDVTDTEQQMKPLMPKMLIPPSSLKIRVIWKPLIMRLLLKRRMRLIRKHLENMFLPIIRIAKDGRFADEFSDGKDESEGWDSLKDLPFAGDTRQTPYCGKLPSTETPEINSISDYMNAHNYGPDDFATYSQDPQWRQLMRQEYPDYELPEMTRKRKCTVISVYERSHIIMVLTTMWNILKTRFGENCTLLCS